ncbi:hypothetical protein [Collimonas sp. PA-H2]|uniref:hypothetical protein n=1 Tax=Collimonas sp. PA-H2 TaxID=1881062 RepID=UPI000BF6ACBF|nr:hypothetical protein [Collimonas sp. PA-H2]
MMNPKHVAIIGGGVSGLAAGIQWFNYTVPTLPMAELAPSGGGTAGPAVSPQDADRRLVPDRTDHLSRMRAGDGNVFRGVCG